MRPARREGSQAEIVTTASSSTTTAPSVSGIARRHLEQESAYQRAESNRQRGAERETQQAGQHAAP